MKAKLNKTISDNCKKKARCQLPQAKTFEKQTNSYKNYHFRGKTSQNFKLGQN